ncbi:TaqI-like C-terminal specificity domain-containing protein [Chryseobacterium indologenes]|uniref:TaqI-like C-terminal specificity domain-containing protein n=1 Tax=Chryseobacterium indologenes TaxID=253 RepID=UPI001629DA54|nr:TaqI-like C-terminal specificity domain-containing protein [Chryseobacterium indologenes]
MNVIFKKINAQKSAEIIRPILRGRDIKRYSYDFNDLWLINTHNGIKEKGIKRVEIDDYPAVKKHLNTFYRQLSKRTDKGDTPYNLRNCAYMEDFYRQKIIWGEISDRTKFSIELDGQYVNEATTFLLVGENLLYIVAFLNSKLSEYFFSKIGTTTGMGTVRWKKFTIEQLYIPKISTVMQQQFEKIVLEIINNVENNRDYSILLKEIDKLIFEIFDFSNEEIEFIELQ